MSNQQVKPASDYQEILEKYDKESVVKTGQSQWQKHIITIVAVAYSLFHLYITFYPMPTLLQRALHVGIGALLIFLVYPAAKKYSKRGIMWFDWILGILVLITAGHLC